MSSRRPLASIVVLASSAVVALAACGGAAESAPPQNAPRYEEPEPTSVEDAQRQIARARAELGGPGAGAAPSDTATPSADSATTKREPAAPPPPPPTSKPAKATEEGPSRASDTCQSPCRAIASMRRAVTALCRMTGDEDARCTDAKKTLADSETKLAPCGC
jgi:hypothetical protein